MEGIPVAYSMNGNNDGWNGGGWWGSLVGGAVGGAAGAAWGRNGNNCGNDGCCNNNDAFVMDGITALQTNLGSVGRDQLMSTANLQAAMCQGFNGTAREIGNVGAQLSQGQCRTEAAVLTTGLQAQIQAKDNTIFQLGAAHAAEVQGMRNTYDLKSSIDNCCCTTNGNIERQGCQTREVLLAEGCATRKAIHDEGEATRALMSQLDRERLLREMCAKDSKIAALEQQQFNTALAAGNLAQMRQESQGQTALILAALRDRTTPATGGAAA